MAERGGAVKLGIFIFIGTALFMIAIFTIGNKEALFSDVFSVRSEFNNIEGLRTGAPVRLSGITIGSVSDIHLKEDESGKVLVTMRLDNDIRRLIKTNTQAFVETEGLVGNKVLILRLGEGAGDPIADDGMLQGVDPMGLAVIIDDIRSVLKNTQVLTESLAGIIASVNKGEGTLGKLVTDDRLYQSAVDLMTTTERSVAFFANRLDSLSGILTSLGSGVNDVLGNIDNVVLDIDLFMEQVKQGKGLLGLAFSEDNTKYKQDIDTILTNFISISENVKVGSERFSENMEALKRNWLFKSYFEERGYYEKTEYQKTLDDYLEQVNQRIGVLDEKIKELKLLQESKK